MNEATDQMLRAEFKHRDRAEDKAFDARERIRDLISELIRIHGPKAVVIWLKARPPRRPQSYGNKEDQFFEDVLRIFPGRGGKGSMIRLLCDASDELRKASAK